MSSLTCDKCDKELIKGDNYYAGNDGSILCDDCGGSVLTLHELTQYDDEPYIIEDEGSWDGGAWEGEQFARKEVK